MKEKIENLKKIELHLHLDGSVNPKLINEYLNTDYNKEIKKSKYPSLTEYLTKFDLPIKYMQTKENLQLAAKDCANYLETQNVCYAEIRFCPLFHIQKGLSLEEVIESVLLGLKQNKKVKTNLILCMMRNKSLIDNLKIINLAEKYLNKGVCAIDLAGDEKHFPLKNYESLFKVAQAKNIPYTIHAGENTTSNEVLLAIKLGAKRIGHGIKSITSKETLNLLKEKDILLEICPTSNYQTNSIYNYEDHPIKKIYDENIPLNINTDNKTISNITLNEEYEKLSKNFNFSLNDFYLINLNSINYTFLSDQEKDELRKNFRQ